jgi:amidase
MTSISKEIMDPNVMSSELTRLTAVDLRNRIASREISPVEVLEAFISRIEALNPAVNAVTATCYERAREEARAAEKAVRDGDDLGPLHGLPFAVKDLENTKDVLTTYGSPLFKDFVPNEDSIAVARLRNAGAIMVGKTNTPEFGAGANTRNSVWGATGNPFDPMKTSGGSSGGSAAALAVDMLPVCTGSDTGGSLRIPAAFCGVVGFRPSPGMVPAERRPLGWTPISVLGPMARNMPDTRLLFESQIGADPSDPLSFPQPPGGMPTREIDLGTLKVAWSTDLTTGIVDEPIARAFQRKLKKLAPRFGRCDEVQLDFGEAERCFDVIRAVSYVARYRADYEADPMRLGPNVRANYELGAKMTLADFGWAHAEQTRIFRRFQELYRDYDILLAPTVAVSPFPWQTLYLDNIGGRKLNTYYHWLAMAWYITLTTNPAVSLPVGTDEFGMPFGLQIVGRFRGDSELFDIATALETTCADDPELARPLPDISRLQTPVPQLKSIITSPPAT